MRKRKKKQPARAAVWLTALSLCICQLPAAPVAAASVSGSSVQTAEEVTVTPTGDPYPAAYYEPVQTDSIAGWPAGPQIFAESGILVDLDNGRILYAKNIDKQLYPASITKVMTTLLAMEHSSAQEPVTFSETALNSIEWDSSNIGCLLGETLTMEQCWYAMLLNSANEVCCGVAEHVAGSIGAFVELMNQRAAELGCTGTHFNNTNGLPDENHYTTAHDMALIARAAFANETFRQVTGTREYQIPATPKYTEIRYLRNHHKMLLPDTEYYYEGCIGGKTGYTEEALNTLVTFAKRDNRTLLCVTMRTQGRQVYTDTASLFDYGFTGGFPEEGAQYLSEADGMEANGDAGESSEAAGKEPSVTGEEAEAVPPPAAEKEEKPSPSIRGLLILGVLVLLFVIRVFSIAGESRRKHRRRKRKKRN